MTEQLDGAASITAERKRQIEEKGFTEAHDRFHRVDTLVKVALFYLGKEKSPWPRLRRKDGDGYWVRENLVKAGAMIAAAIDRWDASRDTAY